MKTFKYFALTIGLAFGIFLSVSSKAQTTAFDTRPQAVTFCSQSFITCRRIVMINEGSGVVEFLAFYTINYGCSITLSANACCPGQDRECDD
jgi:hypothetical protein